MYLVFTVFSRLVGSGDIWGYGFENDPFHTYQVIRRLEDSFIHWQYTGGTTPPLAGVQCCLFGAELGYAICGVTNMIPIYALLSIMAPPGSICFLTQPLLPIKYEPEISRSQIDYKCSRKVSPFVW